MITITFTHGVLEVVAEIDEGNVGAFFCHPDNREESEDPSISELSASVNGVEFDLDMLNEKTTNEIDKRAIQVFEQVISNDSE